MDEIKVVPYIPDEDYDNPAMVVDFYEFTMANCLFLHGFKDTTLVFDMFFRKNPDNQGYSCLLYTSPSPRDGLLSRMPSSA